MSSQKSSGLVPSLKGLKIERCKSDLTSLDITVNYF